MSCFRHQKSTKSFCLSVTPVKDFGDHSYIEWDFKEKFHQMLQSRPFNTDIQLMFRTRQDNGLLFKVQNIQKSEYLILEVSVLFVSEDERRIEQMKAWPLSGFSWANHACVVIIVIVEGSPSPNPEPPSWTRTHRPEMT